MILESETLSINFLYFAILKSIGVSCIFKGYFTHGDSETSCTGHLENTYLLSYAHLPNVDMHHYTIVKKNSHSRCCYKKSFKFSFKVGKLSNLRCQLLKNSNFHPQIFIIGNKYYQLFSWK